MDWADHFVVPEVLDILTRDWGVQAEVLWELRKVFTQRSVSQSIPKPGHSVCWFLMAFDLCVMHVAFMCMHCWP